MKPRYRIHLSYIVNLNSGPECRYHIQRRSGWFFWEDVTQNTLTKEQAETVLAKLLREDTQP